MTDQNHRDLASTLLAQRSAFACPVLNEEFAYECGPGGLEDRTYSRSQHARGARPAHPGRWSAGAATPGYYYAYTAWDVLRPEDEPPGYALHQRLADFMREGEWWTLAPYPGIAPSNTARGARCLANPGAEYLVFCEAGGNATVTLPGAGERAQGMRCDWLQPLTGERARTTETLGPRAQLRPPWGQGTPFVVRLRPAATAPAEDYICSSSRPLVSLPAARHEEDRDGREEGVDGIGDPRPQPVQSGGKVTVTSQFASHCAVTATARAAPRILLLNISPSSTHTTGPQVKPKANT